MEDIILSKEEIIKMISDLQDERQNSLRSTFRCNMIDAQIERLKTYFNEHYSNAKPQQGPDIVFEDPELPF